MSSAFIKTSQFYIHYFLLVIGCLLSALIAGAGGSGIKYLVTWLLLFVLLGILSILASFFFIKFYRHRKFFKYWVAVVMTNFGFLSVPIIVHFIRAL